VIHVVAVTVLQPATPGRGAHDDYDGRTVSSQRAPGASGSRGHQPGSVRATSATAGRCAGVRRRSSQE